MSNVSEAVTIAEVVGQPLRMALKPARPAQTSRSKIPCRRCSNPNTSRRNIRSSDLKNTSQQF